MALAQHNGSVKNAIVHFMTNINLLWLLLFLLLFECCSYVQKEGVDPRAMLDQVRNNQTNRRHLDKRMDETANRAIEIIISIVIVIPSLYSV